MSARRKNAKRLKTLRRYGVPINGSYFVSAEGISKAPRRVQDAMFGIIPLDIPTLLGYVDVKTQKQLLRELT